MLKRSSSVLKMLMLAALVMIPAVAQFAQDLHPSRRASPMGLARTWVGEAYVKVVYSRPYLRGRDNIFGSEDSGALVPYGKLWRTGANEGTEITLTENLLVAGKPLAAGTYSLMTTPGEKEWTVHINSEIGLNGTFKRDAESGQFSPVNLDKDVLTFKVPAGQVEEEVDQFTMSFEAAGDDARHLVITWAKTQVRVPFACDC